MDRLDWDKAGGLIPAVAQHADDGRVLMLGFMNREALEQTLACGEAVFFSRTRQRLWRKGETSGNVLELVSVRPDCDYDTLLLAVRPAGPTCHLGSATCFDQEDPDAGPAAGAAFFARLEEIVAERAREQPEGSYTAALLASGILRVAQKLGEEGVETALAGAAGDRGQLVAEAADLLFHLLVLLRAREVALTEVIGELERRHRGR
jgi:phosphoribosyl-ATP pyrophosphohydrolase/phosphoribosyl-AMP cyclohydrolase